MKKKSKERTRQKEKICFDKSIQSQKMVISSLLVVQRLRRNINVVRKTSFVSTTETWL